MAYHRGFHNAAREPHAVRVCHWCGSRKFPIKNNTHVICMHMRLTVNGVLEGFVRKGDS